MFILVIDVRRAMVNLIEGESKSSAGDIIHGVLSFLLPCYTPFGLPYQLMWIYYDCDLTNKAALLEKTSNSGSKDLLMLC